MSTTKDEKRETVDPARRNFLRAGLVGASAAAVGTGAGVAQAQASESDSEKKKARYKETDHVKKYYATNRY
ncbi:MAG: formate dehydrogenase [Proteobacteria bacterium]|nr:formate dehydrogenase [Pseudomonadota bacterium]